MHGVSSEIKEEEKANQTAQVFGMPENCYDFTVLVLLVTLVDRLLRKPRSHHQLPPCTGELPLTLRPSEGRLTKKGRKGIGFQYVYIRKRLSWFKLHYYLKVHRSVHHKVGNGNVSCKGIQKMGIKNFGKTLDFEKWYIWKMSKFSQKGKAS